MNTQHSPRKSRTILATIIGTSVLILTATAAQADWLSPAFYGDELDRCATELRAELNMTGVTHLRHNVTDIDKVGVWYIFDIRTEMADSSGEVIGRTETRCKAHRWNERTVVEVTKQLLAADVRLARAD